MATIKWQEYLKWRESKGLNNADVMIYVGKSDLVVEVKTNAMIVNGESVVQVQIGGKANVLIPMEMVSEE